MLLFFVGERRGPALLKGMSNLLRIDDLEPAEVYYCKNDSGSNHHNKLINSTEKY